MLAIDLAGWFSFTLLVLPPLVPAPQSRRLNAPLPRPGAADVEADFAWSGDGRHLVFRADLGIDDAFELYASPADAGGPPKRLSGPLVPGGDVVSYVLAGERVVYLADQDEDETFELYATRVSSRLHTLPDEVAKLSGPAAPGGDVLSFRVTPDGRHAVFLADTLVDGRPEFFRAPLDGRTPPVPLDPAPSTEEVSSWWLAPDGAHLAYTRRLRIAPFNRYTERLLALPVDGSQTQVELAVSRSNSGYYGSLFPSLEFTSDGQRVVYSDRLDGKDGGEEAYLFTRPIDASQPALQLNQGLFNGSVAFLLSHGLQRVILFELDNVYSVALDGTGRVQLDPTGHALQDAALTPDGRTLVFQVRFGGPFGSTGALLRVPVDGSQAASTLASGIFRVVQILPTDQGVAWVQRDGGTFDAFGFRALWWRVFDGGAPAVLLNGPALERTGCGTVQLAPGERLLFSNSYLTTAVSELFVVPRDGSLAPQRISAALSGGRDVVTYRPAPAGDGVVYRADQANDGAFELFRTSLEGAPPRAFLELAVGPVVGDVLSFRASADGRRVVFMADMETDQEFRLFHVPLDGREGPTRVGNFSFSEVPDYALAPSGERVVDYRPGDFADLYAVDVAPGSAEVELDHARVRGPLEFTPDSARVVFAHDDSTDELVSAPLDGSEPTVLYRQRDMDVFTHELTPDGTTAVFRAEYERDRKVELLRVAVDGSAPAVRLSEPIGGNRDVTAFRITPDGASALYLVDQRSDEVFELFVAPLAGGRAVQRLSGPLATGGDVLDYAVAPGSRHAVYRADALADERFELFSTALVQPPTGPGRALPGNEPVVVPLTLLSGSELVQPDWKISDDGRQVFFRAGPAARPELFRVPLLGGQAPQLVSVAGYSGVASFALSPDRARVVYLADKRGDGAQELFSVGTEGGPTMGLDPLPAFAAVSLYRITPDSRYVVYLCDRKVDGTNELVRVPIDGSGPAEILNDPLPPGGNVLPDLALLPDGTVVYRADLETDEAFELFAASPPLR